MYSLVARQSYTLQSVPPDIASTPPGPIRSCCDTIDYFLYY